MKTGSLNEVNINDIGKRFNFCHLECIEKPYELAMTMDDKSTYWISDLHRYFFGLTNTDVQHKPFHNQLSKPEFKSLI